MNIFHSFILGLLEGLTEFLPISSTAHLIILGKILSIPENDAFRLFQIVVQVGAILAVIVYFHKKFFDLELIKKLIISFIPTGIVGLLIYPFLKVLLSSLWIVATMLLLGGIIMIVVEKWYANTYTTNALHHSKITIAPLSHLSYKNSFILGCFQALAIIPGTSRSGATIVGGLLLGIKREVLTEYSFLLAVPTMLIATLYTLHKNIALLHTPDVLLPLLIGTITSFIVALIVIKTFLTYIRTRSFEIFGWYRIIVGIILILILGANI